MGLHSFLIVAPGPRPPFYSVAEHLWGEGCDVDSDGDSSAPGARDWTELAIALRPALEEWVEIEPVGGLSRLALRVKSNSLKLAEKAARFLAKYTGGKCSREEGGPTRGPVPNGAPPDYGDWSRQERINFWIGYLYRNRRWAGEDGLHEDDVFSPGLIEAMVALDAAIMKLLPRILEGLARMERCDPAALAAEFNRRTGLQIQPPS
jgi:hypothetical protein